MAGQIPHRTPAFVTHHKPDGALRTGQAAVPDGFAQQLGKIQNSAGAGSVIVGAGFVQMAAGQNRRQLRLGTHQVTGDGIGNTLVSAGLYLCLKPDRAGLHPATQFIRLPGRQVHTEALGGAAHAHPHTFIVQVFPGIPNAGKQPCDIGNDTDGAHLVSKGCPFCHHVADKQDLAPIFFGVNIVLHRHDDLTFHHAGGRGAVHGQLTGFDLVISDGLAAGIPQHRHFRVPADGHLPIEIFGSSVGSQGQHFHGKAGLFHGIGAILSGQIEFIPGKPTVILPNGANLTEAFLRVK